MYMYFVLIRTMEMLHKMNFTVFTALRFFAKALLVLPALVRLTDV